MLVQPSIRNVAPNDSRKICSFELPHSEIGEIAVRVKPRLTDKDRFVSEIVNSEQNVLGSEVFDLFPEKNMIFGYDISVKPANRGKGLGELLRLASIIEMIENKVEEFKIYSKNSAVYFHSKYKFTPDFNTFSYRDEAIRNISNKEDIL